MDTYWCGSWKSGWCFAKMIPLSMMFAGGPLGSGKQCSSTIRVEIFTPFQLKNWSRLFLVKLKFIRKYEQTSDAAAPASQLGSIVGDIAPYEAFSIGGQGCVQGYGEGSVGSGRSCFVAKSELTLPPSSMLEGVVFVDCGSDLGSGRHVPGFCWINGVVKLIEGAYVCKPS